MAAVVVGAEGAGMVMGEVTVGVTIMDMLVVEVENDGSSRRLCNYTSWLWVLGSLVENQTGEYVHRSRWDRLFTLLQYDCDIISRLTELFKVLAVMAVFKETMVIAGITVHMYSAQSDIPSLSTPVAILFLLHGRENTVKSLEYLAEFLIKSSSNPSQKPEGSNGRDLVVITLA